MCESYVHPYSNPWPSATWKSSIIRWYGGSGRTVTPKLSIVPPRSRGRGRAYRRESRADSGGVVLPVRVRRRRDAPVPGGYQRAVGALDPFADPRLIRLFSRRDGRVVRSVGGHLAATARGRPDRRRAVVGLDRRLARRVLQIGRAHV